jgi:hypothetical protein
VQCSKGLEAGERTIWGVRGKPGAPGWVEQRKRGNLGGLPGGGITKTLHSFTQGVSQLGLVQPSLQGLPVLGIPMPLAVEVWWGW